MSTFGIVSSHHSKYDLSVTKYIYNIDTRGCIKNFKLFAFGFIANLLWELSCLLMLDTA